MGTSAACREPARALFTTSLVTMTALNIVDYFSTKAAIRQTGLKEGKPPHEALRQERRRFRRRQGRNDSPQRLGFEAPLQERQKPRHGFCPTVSNFLLSYVVANNMRLIRQNPLTGEFIMQSYLDFYLETTQREASSLPTLRETRKRVSPLPARVHPVQYQPGRENPRYLADLGLSDDHPARNSAP